jgi:hypothetical protein
MAVQSGETAEGVRARSPGSVPQPAMHHSGHRPTAAHQQHRAARRLKRTARDPSAVAAEDMRFELVRVCPHTLSERAALVDGLRLGNYSQLLAEPHRGPVHRPALLRAGRHRPHQPQGAGQHDPPLHHLAEQARCRRTPPRGRHPRERGLSQRSTRWFTPAADRLPGLRLPDDQAVLRRELLPVAALADLTLFDRVKRLPVGGIRAAGTGTALPRGG